MPDPTNKISNFWQELKRRKVMRVIAMYAGSAYIIIELVSNVAEPLRLPEWTATMVIILLAIGFPVMAILSWIFDYTPEGYVKTGPAKEEPDEARTKRGTARKFRLSDAVIIILFIAVCILAWPRIFRPGSKITTDPDGRISISVMPFKNLTNDTLF